MLQPATDKLPPLGATYVGAGTYFSLFSEHATKVELCLFSADGKTEQRRLELTRSPEDGIWRGYAAGVTPGQAYGYRVHGPYDPANGHRFNPNKLMLDPYAKEVSGEVVWGESQANPYQDNAPDVMKSRVTAPLPPSGAPRINRPWHETILYEMHVKGFTQLDPKIPAEKRGTFAALAEDSTIEYLKDLGVTAVEFLPIMATIEEKFLQGAGLRNYWGYNTINYFAPQPDLGPREDLRKAVDKLHAAGIEVIMDVVYNHTAEGDRSDVPLSFRGIDNASYYRLNPGDKSEYADVACCGNALDLRNDAARKMVIDSLRHWVEEYGIDGFRFDLAPVLAKDNGFTQQARFFDDVKKDPVLSQVKLIAEPWDGSNYELGNFPPGWHEWNDKFRDDTRKFWRGDAPSAAQATRLAGSSPEFDRQSRTPQASINMITCHDGFTLHDVVSYKSKHNEANGEFNRDGTDSNYSDNYGAEGETDKYWINDYREKQKRNMLATLFLSQGTPMLLAGDEHGNTQYGNNNAYNQDNRISWLKWDTLQDSGRRLTAFVQKLIQFRKDHPVLQTQDYMHAQRFDADGVPDIGWHHASGRKMDQSDFFGDTCFGVVLNEGAVSGAAKGERLFAIFNSRSQNIDFKLPVLPNGATWQRAIDTASPDMPEVSLDAGTIYNVPSKSVIVFTQKP